MRKIYIIQWHCKSLPEWETITGCYFTSRNEAYQFAERWYRIYADEDDYYNVITLRENWAKKLF